MWKVVLECERFNQNGSYGKSNIVGIQQVREYDIKLFLEEL